MNSTLYVIVPDLPPKINGIGDYSFILSKALNSNGISLNIEFIVAGNSNYEFKYLDGFKVHVLNLKSAMSLFFLLRNLNSSLIHLHYVGYGFAKRGAPLWLYLGLFIWKLKRGVILITTFHELYAISKYPWTSSFWNQWLQRLICKNIFLISKCVITSRDSYRKILFNFSSSIEINVLPVFSNFGEMKEYQEMELREKGLIILGSKSTRSNIYKSYQKELNIICQKHSLNRIIDVGPKIFSLPKLVVPVVEFGILEAIEISGLLKKNSFGIILGLNSNHFAKSGVFASYTSHGIIVVVLDANLSKIEDGIIPNKHFISIDSKNINCDYISKSSYEWYQNHTLEKQCLKYFNIFIKNLKI